MLRLIPREFVRYKFTNSLFLGLSVGSIFVVYQPLDPSIYSLGGIALAIAILIVARFYDKIMNIDYFFKISLLVELIMLGVILFFLIHPYNYLSALIVYIGYQSTFAFGSYLVRAETIILKRDYLLTLIDSAKQLGYLAGLLLSYLFYKALKYFWHISDKTKQVYDLHMVLLVCEIAIIFLLYRSFRKNS